MESLSEAENLFKNIQENKDYIINLQDLLKKGIVLKQEVREKSAHEADLYKEQIDKSIIGLRNSVNNVIKELKYKGYKIETREDYISSGTYAKALDTFVEPAVIGGSLLFGSLAALFTFRERTKGRKVRTLNKALEQTVNMHNNLADNYKKLNYTYTIEKANNSSFPDYSGGNDIY